MLDNILAKAQHARDIHTKVEITDYILESYTVNLRILALGLYSFVSTFW